MKVAIIAARVLLGVMFVFFGANGILMFLKPGPMPPSDATTFMTVLMNTHYMTFISLVMLISGLLILIGRFVPLGLTLLGPILVNILSTHIFLMHGAGISMGLIATAFWLFLFFAYRSSFYGIFQADPPITPTN
jgi:hypothetical protein